jgi:hypothetical protein
MFNNLMQARLPGSTASIAFAGAGPFVYTVQINWTTRITRATNTSVATSGPTTVTGGGQTENFAFTFNKTLYNRTTVY